MKKLFGISALAAVLLSSCAEDGVDGSYYISVNDVACIADYTDNNDCVPYGMSYYHSYGPCDNTGSMNYTFHYCGGGGWTGTYSIYVNEGGPKKLFRDGEDGADRYYSLDLTSSGLSYDYRSTTHTGKEDFTQKDFVAEFDNSRETMDKYVDLGQGVVMHITGRRLNPGEMPIANPKYKKN